MDCGQRSRVTPFQKVALGSAWRLDCVPPELNRLRHCQLSAMWKVLAPKVDHGADKIVAISFTKSDPRESCAGYMYGCAKLKILMARRTAYYWTNIATPMGALTYMSAMSAAHEPNGEPMGTADRLSVTLTLLLTAVAYKFVVASSLPTVSYWTVLDKYVLLCFLFILLFSVENVVFPTFLMDRSDPGNVQGLFPEAWLVAAYLASFTVLNVWFGRVAWLKWSARFHYMEPDSGLQWSDRGL